MSRRATPPLGQHFLRAPWVLAKMIAAAGVAAEDTVLEIGPGEGVLTAELLKTGANVVAVERDAILVPHLQERFASELAKGQLVLVHGDIRNFNPVERGLRPRSYKLVANIPYYITGEIIRTFLTHVCHPSSMTLLIQKEVAERIARSLKESILSLSVKAYGVPKYVISVAAGNFNPPPTVESAVLHVHSISHDAFTHLKEEAFFKVVHAGFAAKRKMLRSNLGEKYDQADIARACTDCVVIPTDRGEDIPLKKWLCLAEKLG
jgi:16S rRNA (adenine1518-N6/adenine1519-N6)-dimethyltransferase